jgi:hypothetical protein
VKRVVGIVALASLLAACGGSSKKQPQTIVLEHSIGPVTLHESLQDVERAIGRGTTIHNDQHFGHEIRYPNGLDVFYAPGPKDEEAVFAVLTTSPSYRTSAGLGVGSSLGDVKALGGVACHGSAVCQHGANAPGRPGTGFLFRDGKVWRVQIAVDFD